MKQPTETGTALILPQADKLAVLLKSEDGPPTVISQIRKQALDAIKGLDPAKPADRAKFKSTAYAVSQTKAEIERQALAVTEAQRREVKAVNAGRKIFDEALSELRDEIRKPAVDWEEAEATRLAALEERVRSEFTDREIPTTSAAISELRDQIRAITIEEAEWQEQVFAATIAREELVERLTSALAAATKEEERVIAQAEMEAENQRMRDKLAKLEAEEAERKEREAAAERERIAALEREAEEQRQKEAAEERARAERRNFADSLLERIREIQSGEIDGIREPFPVLIRELEVGIQRGMDRCGDLWAEVDTARLAALEERRAAFEAHKTEAEEERRKQAELDRQAEIKRAAAAKRATADALLDHIRQARSGLIDGKGYPFPVLIHDLEARMLRDAEACGEHWPEVDAARLEAIQHLKEWQAEAEAESKRIAEEEAEKDREKAAQAERDRIAQEQARERLAQELREQNEAHRAKIRKAIVEALVAVLPNAADLASARLIADALMKGEIPHCEVRL